MVHSEVIISHRSMLAQFVARKERDKLFCPTARFDFALWNDAHFPKFLFSLDYAHVTLVPRDTLPTSRAFSPRSRILCWPFGRYKRVF